MRFYFADDKFPLNSCPVHYLLSPAIIYCHSSGLKTTIRKCDLTPMQHRRFLYVTGRTTLA